MSSVRPDVVEALVDAQLNRSPEALDLLASMDRATSAERVAARRIEQAAQAAAYDVRTRMLLEVRHPGAAMPAPRTGAPSAVTSGPQSTSIWLSTTEAAERAHRNVQTVRRALDAGDLHGSQRRRGGKAVPGGVWSIHVDCLDAWIAGTPCPRHPDGPLA